MRRYLALTLLAGSMAVLSGCAATLAASASNAVVRAVQGPVRSNEGFRGSAVDECSARAAPYGTVHIIDVQQARVDKLIIWGTADDGKVRHSFKCGYTRKITGFTVRVIPRN